MSAILTLVLIISFGCVQKEKIENLDKVIKEIEKNESFKASVNMRVSINKTSYETDEMIYSVNEFLSPMNTEGYLTYYQKQDNQKIEVYRKDQFDIRFINGVKDDNYDGLSSSAFLEQFEFLRIDDSYIKSIKEESTESNTIIRVNLKFKGRLHKTKFFSSGSFGSNCETVKKNNIKFVLNKKDKLEKVITNYTFVMDNGLIIKKSTSVSFLERKKQTITYPDGVDFKDPQLKEALDWV